MFRGKTWWQPNLLMIWCGTEGKEIVWDGGSEPLVVPTRWARCRGRLHREEGWKASPCYLRGWRTIIIACWLLLTFLAHKISTDDQYWSNRHDSTWIKIKVNPTQIDLNLIDTQFGVITQHCCLCLTVLLARGLPLNIDKEQRPSKMKTTLQTPVGRGIYSTFLLFFCLS